MKNMWCIFILLIFSSSSGFSTAMTEGEILRSYGLLTGDYYGDLREEDFVTRAEMMVLLSRMLGEFEQASNFAGNVPFQDDLGHWASPYVSYAFEKGWTAGIGGNMFGYNHPQTLRETSVFMLKALDYLPGQDFSLQYAYDYAVRLGLLDHEGFDPEDSILRRDLFKIMLRTLNTNVKGSDFPLIHFVETSRDAFKVDKIRLLSNNAIEVIFNEPIETIGKAEVLNEGKALKIQTIQKSGEDRTIILLDETLVGETEYLVSISDFISKQSKYSILYHEPVVYTAYSEPSYIKVIKATQTNLEIEFSSPVKGLTASHIVYGVGNMHPLGIYLDEEMTYSAAFDQWVSKIFIKCAEKSGGLIEGSPLMVGHSILRVTQYNDRGAGLIGIQGDAYEGGIFEVSVEGDGDAPYITRLELIGNTGFHLDFNEEVRLSLGNIDIRYSSGALIPNLWLSLSGSGKNYRIQLNGADLSGKTIRINIRNVEDLAFIPNVMTLHSTTFWIPDLEKPKIVNVLQDTNTKACYVTFSKPVDKTSATTRSRYAIALGSSTLVLSNTPIQVTNTIYKLNLTNIEFILAQSSGAQLTVNNVQDVNGNVMESQSFNFSTMNDVSKTPPQLVSVYATDSRSVTAVFNQPLTRVDSGAFKVNLASVSSMTFAVSGGQTLVRLQTASALPANLASVSLLVDTTGVSKVQNLYGIDVRNTTRVIEDRR